MTTAALFGSTGAVGGVILSTLLASETFSSIKTISRRLPQDTSPKLEALQEADSSTWGSKISTLQPKPETVFNAVGTTRAQAGGIAAQKLIDQDLCIAIAQAAKEAGVQTYVFISSAGTRGLLASYVPYSKMKVAVEDAIQELDFPQAIIVRPGMILAREKAKAPLLEAIIGRLHFLGQGVQDRIGMFSRLFTTGIDHLIV